MAKSGKLIRKLVPWIIPLILAIIQMVQSAIDSPAFYTRIDPEYLCLLNGLNASILKFNNIGYVDLPGTPFLILTGIFIRITHFLFGEGQIYIDVISRPEFYLHTSSFMLMLLTTFILVWGGKKIYRTKSDLPGMIILQSTFLLTAACLHIPTRYWTDRILPLYAFVFAIFTILYFRDEIKEKKYAIISGIIMGVGLITKLNFFPLLIIPIFLIRKFKNHLIYIGVLILSAIISILPVISKIKYIKNFIFSMITHDGMYGNGQEKILNLEKIFQNIAIIQELNFSFSILFVLTIVTLLFLIIIPKIRKQNRLQFLFLIAFVIATFVEVIMVSKHFKDYYFAPILALSGLVLFVIWHVTIKYYHLRQSIINLVVFAVMIFLIIPNLKVFKHSIHTKQRIEDRQLSIDFLAENRKASDWLFLEPSWKSDPTIENALMWGISYVARRNDFLQYYKQVYPRVLSFEGVDKPITQFRCGPADEEQFMASKGDIFLMSIPGDQTQEMISQLNQVAEKYKSTLQFDTVFVNQKNKDIIIKASHIIPKFNTNP